MKWFFQRLIDVAICAALLSGIKVLGTFAAVIVAVMVCVFALGPFVMDAKIANKLTEGGIIRSAVRFAVLGMYLSALLLSNHPYLAAFYLITATWTLKAAYRCRAEATGAA